MELKGWKAGVVLTAAIIIIANAVVGLSAIVLLAFVH